MAADHPVAAAQCLVSAQRLESAQGPLLTMVSEGQWSTITGGQRQLFHLMAQHAAGAGFAGAACGQVDMTRVVLFEPCCLETCCVCRCASWSTGTSWTLLSAVTGCKQLAPHTECSVTLAGERLTPPSQELSPSRLLDSRAVLQHRESFLGCLRRQRRRLVMGFWLGWGSLVMAGAKRQLLGVAAQWQPGKVASS